MANTTQYYIVPINVQGVRATKSDLTYGGTPSRFKGPTVRFSSIESGNGLGEAIDQQLASAGASSQISEGVHLHWALPDAITHAYQGPDGELEFPSAPNRWLVTRYLCEYNTALKGDGKDTPPEENLAPPIVRQWIIESNKVNPQDGLVETYPTSIFKKDGTDSPTGEATEGPELPSSSEIELPPLEENYLGSRAAYNSDWKDQEAEAEPGEYDPAITVISYYGPSFGAYYQNCATTFGLHDDFKDYIAGKESGYLNVANFSVSYQVIGWYSKPDEHDVLMITLADARKAYERLTAEEQAQTSIQAFLAKTIEDELQWQLSDSGDANEWPTHAQSIYNGMALNIQWLTGPRGEGHRSNFLPLPQEVIDASSLELAIGNNSSEAMSALISKKEVVKNPAPGENEPYPEVEKDVELLFNAFQQDLLRKLKGTDLSLQLAELEEYLHSARFSSHKGGNLWHVQPEETQTNGSQKLKSSSSAEVGLPLAAAELLSLLNNTQREYDKEMDALHSRQHQAYLDYTSYGLIHNNPKYDADPDDDSSISTNIQSYLTSELLKIYSESAKTGRIEETDNAGGKASFTFKPNWTLINKKAEQAVLELASAQGQWWFLYPQTLQLIDNLVEEANASFSESNYTSASDTLQQINKAPLGQVIQTLSAFFNTATSPLLTAIDNQINSLEAEANILAPILAGITNVQNTYVQENIFPGGGALYKFLPQCKEATFTATNLLDLQQIYVELEAANYYRYDLVATGARLKEALAIAQQATKDIATAIKNLQTLKNLLLKSFDSAYQSLGVLSENVANAIRMLGTIASLNPVDSADEIQRQQKEITGYLSIISKRIAAILANEPTRIAQGLQLQACWQMLLNYLPTGHQVMILVNVVQSVTTLIDFSNKLRRNPANAFWAPNEPVLLITEPKGAENVLVRINRNGKANLLPCRQESELLRALQLNDKTIGGNELAATAIGKAYANIGALQPLVQALLNEGYLITPQASYDLLTNAAQLGNNLTLDLIAAQIALVKQQESIQHNERIPATEKDKAIAENLSSALTVTFQGTLPYYIGMTDLWKGDINYTPFLPLFLAWSADFNPVEMNNLQLDTDYITSNFELGPEHVDMVCSKALLLQQTQGRLNPVTLYGQITLSNQASYALLHQVRLYFKNKGIDITNETIDTSSFNTFEKDLYEAYEYFDKKVILSQGMNGFNSSLLEQLQLLQLPVNGQVVTNDDPAIGLLDFLIPKWNNPAFDRTTVGPNQNTNYFLPLRAGMLQMKELYIVDAFGRYFQIGDVQSNQPVQNQMIVSSSMKAGANCGQDNNNIYLPPRFVQPLQLSFEWLSSASLEGGETTFVERTKQPAFSPICGWILPNHLDNSLSLYDASGDPLGSLGLEGLKQIATWRSVPSAELGDVSDNGRNQMVQDIADANPFFRDFLQQYAFPSGGASYFQQFLDILEQSQVYIHSANLQQEKGLAVLLGRPLVLVRAELRLDLQGLPEVGVKDDNIIAAAEALSKTDYTKPETWLDYDIDQRFRAGYTEVACPVQLGDLHQFDDGLVGFFLNDDWSIFFSPVATTKKGAIQQSTFETIELLPHYHDRESNLVEKGSGQNQANTTQKSVIVTMLMDPRADVHATTGILPVQSINIPGDQYAAVLNKLMVYFQANPVLMGKQQIGLPLPDERGYDWAWAQPGLDPDQPLPTDYISDKAQFNYSPQTIRDGWLKLQQEQEQKQEQ